MGKVDHNTNPKVHRTFTPKSAPGADFKHLQASADKVLSDHKFPWARTKIDGVPGPLSWKAIGFAAFCIGLSKAQVRNIHEGKITEHAQLYIRREKPRTDAMKKRDAERVERLRAIRERHADPDPDGDGLATWEGTTVDAGFIPALKYAKKHGWDGTVVSGYRTPEYSESLCYAMCGSPACPGRCAGKSSRHSQKNGEGAIDVSDYYTFGRLMEEGDFPWHNSLGAADPVHFSRYGN